MKDKITARQSISNMKKQLVPSSALIEWAGDQHEVPSTAAAPKIQLSCDQGSLIRLDTLDAVQWR